MSLLFNDDDGEFQLEEDLSDLGTSRSEQVWQATPKPRNSSSASLPQVNRDVSSGDMRDLSKPLPPEPALPSHEVKNVKKAGPIIPPRTYKAKHIVSSAPPETKMKPGALSNVDLNNYIAQEESKANKPLFDD